MKLFITAALLVGLLMPLKAQAATEYVLVYTNFNPYYTQVVAGPFNTFSECFAVRAQESFTPGGIYSCRIVNY